MTDAERAGVESRGARVLRIDGPEVYVERTPAVDHRAYGYVDDNAFAVTGFFAHPEPLLLGSLGVIVAGVLIMLYVTFGFRHHDDPTPTTPTTTAVCAPFCMPANR